MTVFIEMPTVDWRLAQTSAAKRVFNALLAAVLLQQGAGQSTLSTDVVLSAADGPTSVPQTLLLEPRRLVFAASPHPVTITCRPSLSPASGALTLIRYSCSLLCFGRVIKPSAEVAVLHFTPNSSWHNASITCFDAGTWTAMTTTDVTIITDNENKATDSLSSEYNISNFSVDTYTRVPGTVNDNDTSGAPPFELRIWPDLLLLNENDMAVVRCWSTEIWPVESLLINVSGCLSVCNYTTVDQRPPAELPRSAAFAKELLMVFVATMAWNSVTIHCQPPQSIVEAGRGVAPASINVFVTSSATSSVRLSGTSPYLEGDEGMVACESFSTEAAPKPTDFGGATQMLTPPYPMLPELDLTLLCGGCSMPSTTSSTNGVKTLSFAVTLDWNNVLVTCAADAVTNQSSLRTDPAALYWIRVSRRPKLRMEPQNVTYFGSGLRDIYCWAEGGDGSPLRLAWYWHCYNCVAADRMSNMISGRETILRLNVSSDWNDVVIECRSDAYQSLSVRQRLRAYDLPQVTPERLDFALGEHAEIKCRLADDELSATLVWSWSCIPGDNVQSSCVGEMNSYYYSAHGTGALLLFTMTNDWNGANITCHSTEYTEASITRLVTVAEPSALTSPSSPMAASTSMKSGTAIGFDNLTNKGTTEIWRSTLPFKGDPGNVVSSLETTTEAAASTSDSPIENISPIVRIRPEEIMPVIGQTTIVNCTTPGGMQAAHTLSVEVGSCEDCQWDVITAVDRTSSVVRLTLTFIASKAWRSASITCYAGIPPFVSRVTRKVNVLEPPPLIVRPWPAIFRYLVTARLACSCPERISKDLQWLPPECVGDRSCKEPQIDRFDDGRTARMTFVASSSWLGTRIVCVDTLLNRSTTVVVYVTNIPSLKLNWESLTTWNGAMQTLRCSLLTDTPLPEGHQLRWRSGCLVAIDACYFFERVGSDFAQMTFNGSSAWNNTIIECYLSDDRNLSITARVTVHALPHLTVSPASVNAYVNERHQMRCSASSGHVVPSLLEWWPGADVLHSAQAIVRHVAHDVATSYYELTTDELWNGRSLSCRYGAGVQPHTYVSSAAVTVRVYDYPTLLLTPPEPLFALGENVTMLCYSNGYVVGGLHYVVACLTCSYNEWTNTSDEGWQTVRRLSFEATESWDSVEVMCAVRGRNWLNTTVAVRIRGSVVLLLFSYVMLPLSIGLATGGTLVALALFSRGSRSLASQAASTTLRRSWQTVRPSSRGFRRLSPNGPPQTHRGGSTGVIEGQSLRRSGGTQLLLTATGCAGEDLRLAPASVANTELEQQAAKEKPNKPLTFPLPPSMSPLNTTSTALVRSSVPVATAVAWPSTAAEFNQYAQAAMAAFMSSPYAANLTFAQQTQQLPQQQLQQPQQQQQPHQQQHHQQQIVRSRIESSRDSLQLPSTEQRRHSTTVVTPTSSLRSMLRPPWRPQLPKPPPTLQERTTDTGRESESSGGSKDGSNRSHDSQSSTQFFSADGSFPAVADINGADRYGSEADPPRRPPKTTETPINDAGQLRQMTVAPGGVSSAAARAADVRGVSALKSTALHPVPTPPSRARLSTLRVTLSLPNETCSPAGAGQTTCRTVSRPTRVGCATGAGKTAATSANMHDPGPPSAMKRTSSTGSAMDQGRRGHHRSRSRTKGRRDRRHRSARGRKGGKSRRNQTESQESSNGGVESSEGASTKSSNETSSSSSNSSLSTDNGSRQKSRGKRGRHHRGRSREESDRRHRRKKSGRRDRASTLMQPREGRTPSFGNKRAAKIDSRRSATSWLSDSPDVHWLHSLVAPAAGTGRPSGIMAASAKGGTSTMQRNAQWASTAPHGFKRQSEQSIDEVGLPLGQLTRSQTHQRQQRPQVATEAYLQANSTIADSGAVRTVPSLDRHRHGSRSRKSVTASSIVSWWKKLGNLQKSALASGPSPWRSRPAAEDSAAMPESAQQLQWQEPPSQGTTRGARR